MSCLCNISVQIQTLFHCEELAAHSKNLLNSFWFCLTENKHVIAYYKQLHKALIIYKIAVL